MESKIKYVFILFAFSAFHLLYSVKAAKKLPGNFPKCHRNAKNINECLLKATEEVRPFLKKGIPELNIPSLLSFFIPEIVLEQGTQAVTYKTTLSNLTIDGLEAYNFTRFDFDPKNSLFHVEIVMPSIMMKGQYIISGKILVAQLEGKGNFFFKAVNSNGTLFHYIKYFEKNGIEYMKTDKTVTKLQIGEVVDYNIQGLFQDNEALATATNNVIKENMREIINEMLPAVEKVMTTLFEDLIFKSLAKISLDQLFPK